MGMALTGGGQQMVPGMPRDGCVDLAALQGAGPNESVSTGLAPHFGDVRPSFEWVDKLWRTLPGNWVVGSGWHRVDRDREQLLPV